MGSPTRIHKTRKRLKKHNAGRKRKNQLDNRGTTPTKAAVFGDK